MEPHDDNDEAQFPFSQEYLYGERIDDIMNFLSMKTSDLIGNTASDFEAIINEHLKDVWTSKKSQLPSLKKNFEWVNTSRPLSFEEDLGKKVYVLDFFTYCCINCIHILPHLKKVESDYAYNHGFSVIGVHSPKFPNEKKLERVKEAVLRNDIKHPVVNDSKCEFWKTYGVCCWPTVFIVGPAHTLLFVLMGEMQIEKLPFLCHHVLAYFESCGVELDACPIPISEAEKPERGKLLFPGSISTYGNYLLVSDTGHNRLILVSKDTDEEMVIGSGTIGCKDGPFHSASFNSPHGTAWFNDMAYVADTGNHSIRKVDLKNKLVSTVFKSEYFRGKLHDEDQPSNSTIFFSPWDVCVGPMLDSDLSKLNVLYIAVAGSHQIWALDLEADESRPGFCIPFAGSGKEENRPNSYRMKAGFAQPSGIDYSDIFPGHLYVADSESSTIKSIALKGGAVRIVVGGGHDPIDLFQYGDEDGKYMKAKLQHPMSVCVFSEGLLAITDTYNHKVKVVDLKKNECYTYRCGFCEPSSICVSNGKLLVADTNNHRIMEIPWKIKLSADEVDDVMRDYFKNIPSESLSDKLIELSNLSPQNTETVVELDYDGRLYCTFYLIEKDGFECNKQHQKWDFTHEGDSHWNIVYEPGNIFDEAQPFATMASDTIVDQSSDKKDVWKITLNLSFCDNKLKVCCTKQVIYKVFITFAKNHPKAVRLKFDTHVGY